MHYRGNKHVAMIAGKAVAVDSNLEESVLIWLEDNGFHDRWRRLDVGFRVGNNNYTPDLELAVQFDGVLHRALVEIKPNKAAFTPYVSRRMRGIAKHYHTQLMLLYADNEKSWYRIDIASGELALIDPPTPSKRPINKIPGRITVKSKRIYNHVYVSTFNPLLPLARAAADTLETILIGPRKTRRVRKARRSLGRKKKP